MNIKQYEDRFRSCPMPMFQFVTSDRWLCGKRLCPRGSMRTTRLYAK